MLCSRMHISSSEMSWQVKNSTLGSNPQFYSLKPRLDVHESQEGSDPRSVVERTPTLKQ